MDKRDVIIVGGGPAGVSAALWCKRLDLNHVLLESNSSVGGQLFQIHNEIIDYLGVTAKNGIELQQLLREQVKDMSCTINYNSSIYSIDVNNKIIFYKEDNCDQTIQYEFLILATGSVPKKLGIRGEKEMLERGELYSATRDKDKFNGKSIAIVGGGDRAFEGAYLFAEAGANVYLIHRSTNFKARKTYQDRVFNDDNIKVLTNSKVKAIIGKTKVEAIEIKHNHQISCIEVEAVVVRVGVEPNSGIVSGQIELDETGYIVVNRFGQTSEQTVLAIGDVCTRPAYSSISTSVGQGMIAAKFIAESLKTFDR